MSYLCKSGGSDSNRLPRIDGQLTVGWFATMQRAPRDASYRTRNGDFLRSPERAEPCRMMCARGSRTHGDTHGDRTRGASTPVRSRFTRSVPITRPQNDESRLGGARRLYEKSLKTAYICLILSFPKAANEPNAPSAHDSTATPCRHRPSQLKYTTAFMTRSECTDRARFVKQNFEMLVWPH
jgi:hypothetical protein